MNIIFPPQNHAILMMSNIIFCFGKLTILCYYFCVPQGCQISLSLNLYAILTTITVFKILYVRIYMNMEISQYEADILDIQYDLQRMSYLQRKSRVRLQMISKAKRSFLRSIRDQHSSLRILIIGLLLKIYSSTGGKEDEDRIIKFKQIVYSSQLQSLTTSRGFYKEQLHKNVAVQLLRLQASTNIEEQVLDCFNCVAFFDEVLMLSFKEYYQFEKEGEVQFWKDTIRREFLFTINLNDKLKVSAHDTITVSKEGNELYLPFNTMIILQETEGASIITSNEQSSDKTLDAKNKIIQTVSIDQSVQSPLQFSAHKNKQNVDLLNCSRKITPFESNTRQSHPIKREPFWSMFCCGSD